MSAVKIIDVVDDDGMTTEVLIDVSIDRVEINTAYGKRTIYFDKQFAMWWLRQIKKELYHD